MSGKCVKWIIFAYFIIFSTILHNLLLEYFWNVFLLYDWISFWKSIHILRSSFSPIFYTWQWIDNDDIETFHKTLDHILLTSDLLFHFSIISSESLYNLIERGRRTKLLNNHSVILYFFRDRGQTVAAVWYINSVFWVEILLFNYIGYIYILVYIFI